jgi:hypothetical protein
MRLRYAAFVLLLALSACAGSENTVTPPERDAAAHPLADSLRPYTLTAAKQADLTRNFARVLPPQVLAQLKSLAAPPHRADASAAKRAAVALPHSITGGAPYVSGNAGFISSDYADTSNQFVATLGAPSLNFPQNFAYVIYRFDDVLATARTVQVQGTGTGTVGFAAYNWGYGSAGQWEPLYYGPIGAAMQGTLEFPLGADFTNGGDDLALVVFSLFPSVVDILEVTLTEDSMNIPPVAELTALPSYGAAPLNTLLDAGGSGDLDGSIVKYRFDPLGDGNWIDNGADPTLAYMYDVVGQHTALVEVTDDFGHTAQAQLALLASTGSYDEVEENDSPGQQNSLPPIPFTDLTGNVGFGGPYNDDDSDLFSFDANTGDEVTFTLYSTSAANVGMILVDAAFQTMAAANGSEAVLSYKFQAGDSGPFTLGIFGVDGHSDYILHASDILYSEAEHNDSAVQSNWLAGLTQFDHQLANFKGSFGDGPGYHGYDGDLEDWYNLYAGVTSELDLTLTYDAGTANAGFSLYDYEGDLLAFSATGSGSESLNYTFQPGDLFPCMLHCVCSSGYTDYALNGSVTYDGSAYDEVENNDDWTQTNTLPSGEFTDYKGNVGINGPYDADSGDYFDFTASVGTIEKYTVEWDNPAVVLQGDITDANQSLLTQISQSPGKFELYHLPFAIHTQPYVLRVEVQSGEWTDYTIRRETISGYSEIEDNDDENNANALPILPFPFFSGSLGSGGSDYDGDNVDWFEFTVEDGEWPGFLLYTEGVSVNLRLYDAEGDELAVTFSSLPIVDLFKAEPMQAGDLAPYRIRIETTGDPTDYWLYGGFVN